MAGSDSMTEGARSAELNRYAQIIERIFLSRHAEGIVRIPFARTDIVQVAQELGIELPKNLGDILYSFRFRVSLPESVRVKAPAGHQWVIRLAGRGRYEFVATTQSSIIPNELLAETKVPDSTPGVIAMYALDDEQALLAKVRYNRLIDIFTGVACYSLQGHLRTSVPLVGQVETDEIYVGLDRQGVHYVFPVQAKGGRDRLSVVQVEQDFALCAAKFPSLICRPIGAQFMSEELIALFSFEEAESGIAISAERHYRIVPADDVTETDLHLYRTRSD